jgi:hypothetical protein
MTFAEYTRHIDWPLTVDRRRARQTARQPTSTILELRQHRIRVKALALQLLEPPQTGPTAVGLGAIPYGPRPSTARLLRLEAERLINQDRGDST